MDNEAFAAKKEKLAAIDELLESDGYALLISEIKARGDKGTTECCNVKLSLSERDAGAGKKELAEYLLEYVPQLKRSLEATVGKEKISRGSRKRRTE